MILVKVRANVPEGVHEKLLVTFISNEQETNFVGDNFFANNAINSFKKFHPNVDIIYITDSNFQDYLKELNITEYYDQVGIVRIHIIKELMKQKHYFLTHLF